MMWIKNNNIEDVGLSMFFEVDVVSVSKRWSYSRARTEIIFYIIYIFIIYSIL